MAKLKLDKTAIELNISTDEVIDVGGVSSLVPPVLTPETEFEKLLQEETARFNLPLALRKSPRATAGMSKFSLTHEEEMEEDAQIFSKPSVKSIKVKEVKHSTKRKLDLGSSTPSGKVKHKDKHKDKHKSKHKKDDESIEDYVAPSSKKQKIGALRDQDSRNDFYCWYCHKEGSVICCELCPRVYHTRCLKYESEPEGDWVCPVCQKVLESECVDTQSKAMAKLSVSQLSRLLNFALKRMKHQGTDSFQKPVSLTHFPDYAAFVFNPMDLGTLEDNIKKNVYGSTYAFLEETKWILHNCIIFNGSHHKLTNRAKSVVKICDYEMNEIEICPSCYLSSCLKRTHWFSEPCDPPHPIVWAKLQGFPYWQAKVLRESNGQVDVRFFGQHDRAWLAMQNCFLLSEESPTASKKNSARLINASKEVKIYVENVKEKFGSFEYAPKRTPYKAGMCLAGSTSMSPTKKRSPAKPIKPLSGKPAAFMNGIREAEAAAQEAKLEESNVSEQGEDVLDDGADDIPQSQTRNLSESASIDEDSMDSMSQDSSIWSVGSSQSSEKHDRGVTGSKVQVADCTMQKSRMGGMKVVVKKMNSKTSKDGVPELTPRSAESARRVLQTDEGSPSKKAIPAGVFEISNESLDVSEDQGVKSPAIQLLGKVHVSPKRFDFKKDTTTFGDRENNTQKELSPSSTKHADVMNDAKEIRESQGSIDTTTTDCKDSRRNESDTNATEVIKDPKKVGGSHEQVAMERPKKLHPPVKVKVELKGQSAISADGDSESSSISSSGSSLQSILPSKLPDPAGLDEADVVPKTPDSETPSTSKGTPRSSDKFHINLTRTIETMKASLGMESMETNDNSESDSETESLSAHELEHDSDSSDAHSEGSSMEVDAQKEDEGEKKMDEQDAAKDNVPKTDDVSNDLKNPDPDERQSIKEDDKVKDQGSEVASEGGCAMSLNSADDQSESELVIDMDRMEGVESSSVVKDPPHLEKSDNIVSAPSRPSESEDKLTGSQSEIQNRTNNCSTESTDAMQQNSSTENKCDSNNVRTTGEENTSDDIPKMPKIRLGVKLYLPPNSNKQDTVSEDSTAPVIVESATPAALTIVSATPAQKIVSATSILASHKLAEIVQQKELEEKMLSQPKMEMVVSETPKTEEKMDVDGSVMKVVSDKDTDSKTLSEKKEEDYPEEEDPLKAWGTADGLLEKYSNEVSKCVRESLTTVRRDLIDSITSVDIKTQLEQLQSQVTRLTWEKEQLKKEQKHIMELTISEMRESLNADLKTCEANTKKEAQTEKEEAVKETKKKQWCAQCEQEAYFYCCWNTSYCSYLCQQKHWTSHQTACQQRNTQNATETTSQPPTTSQGTITIATAASTATSGSVNVTTNSGVRIMSAQRKQQIQLVQTAPVTAAQTTSTVTPQSVQTLIRYVQAPPRLPLQSGTLQPQPTQQIIRVPVNQVGGQLVRTLPATIRQVGGQQQLVVSSQALQSLQGKKPVPNLYNV